MIKAMIKNPVVLLQLRPAAEEKKQKQTEFTFSHFEFADI